jgi:hypothetical protein
MSPQQNQFVAQAESAGDEVVQPARSPVNEQNRIELERLVLEGSSYESIRATIRCTGVEIQGAQERRDSRWQHEGRILCTSKVLVPVDCEQLATRTRRTSCDSSK